jgi:hypothetical protein
MLCRLESQRASRDWAMVPTTEAGGSVAMYEWRAPFTVSVAARSVWRTACVAVGAALGSTAGRAGLVLSLHATLKRRTQRLATRAALGSARCVTSLFVFMGFER